jgi:hypothetical protein
VREEGREGEKEREEGRGIRMSQQQLASRVVGAERRSGGGLPRAAYSSISVRARTVSSKANALVSTSDKQDHQHSRSLFLSLHRQATERRRQNDREGKRTYQRPALSQISLTEYFVSGEERDHSATWL